MELINRLFKSNLGASLIAIKASFIALGLMFYWVYDAALMAAYGIGPELNVKGLFESQLMLSSIAIHILKPLVVVALGIFFIGVSVAVVIARICGAKTTSETGPCLLRSVKNMESMPVVVGFSHLLLIAIFFVLCLLAGVLHFSAKAQMQVSAQINTFLSQGNCTDVFADHSHGCYNISGEEGDGHLLIFYGDHALAYMRRIKSSVGKHRGEVVIVYKEDGRKVVRPYAREALVKP